MTDPAMGMNGQIFQNLPQMMINNMATKYIGKLMDQSNTSIFSIKTLAKIMLILSIDEMRKGVSTLVISGKTYAPTILTYLWTNRHLLNTLIQKLKFTRKVNIIEKPIKQIKIIDGSCYNFEWKNCQVYSKLIHNQITNNSKVIPKKIYGSTINSVEHGKTVYNVEYRDVKIPISEDKFLVI